MDEWTCQQCTLANDADADTCDACGAPRPRVSRRQHGSSQQHTPVSQPSTMRSHSSRVPLAGGRSLSSQAALEIDSDDDYRPPLHQDFDDLEDGASSHGTSSTLLQPQVPVGVPPAGHGRLSRPRAVGPPSLPRSPPRIAPREESSQGHYEQVSTDDHAGEGSAIKADVEAYKRPWEKTVCATLLCLACVLIPLAAFVVVKNTEDFVEDHAGEVKSTWSNIFSTDKSPNLTDSAQHLAHAADSAQRLAHPAQQLHPSVHLQPPQSYNCADTASWSDDKKQWCCHNEGIGCLLLAAASTTDTTTTATALVMTTAAALTDASTTLPFNCSAGYANWEVGWSFKKKRWCCWFHQRGCPSTTATKTTTTETATSTLSTATTSTTTVTTTTSLPYNCEIKEADPDTHWPPGKQAWCCLHHDLGCPTRVLPYDCHEGYDRWVEEWSYGKRAWCCLVSRRACSDAPPPVRVQATATTTRTAPARAERPEEGCDRVCRHRGWSASCRVRIQYAAVNEFLWKPHACDRAYMKVRSQCPVCSKCPRSDTGCGTPAPPDNMQLMDTTSSQAPTTSSPATLPPEPDAAPPSVSATTPAAPSPGSQATFPPEPDAAPPLVSATTPAAPSPRSQATLTPEPDAAPPSVSATTLAALSPGSQATATLPPEPDAAPPLVSATTPAAPSPGSQATLPPEPDSAPPLVSATTPAAPSPGSQAVLPPEPEGAPPSAPLTSSTVPAPGSQAVRPPEPEGAPPSAPATTPTAPPPRSQAAMPPEPGSASLPATAATTVAPPLGKQAAMPPEPEAAPPSFLATTPAVPLPGTRVMRSTTRTNSAVLHPKPDATASLTSTASPTKQPVTSSMVRLA